jgi:hypothetical protein
LGCGGVGLAPNPKTQNPQSPIPIYLYISELIIF